MSEQPPLFPRPERDPTDLGLIPQQPDPAPHHCDAGWIGETEDGRLIPCLRCKPHLRYERHGWKVTKPLPEKDRR